MPTNQEERRKLAIAVGVVLSLALLIIPVTVTYVTLSAPFTAVFAPGETRILPLPYTWCQGAVLSSGALAKVTTSMSLLRTTPMLAGRNNITLTSASNSRFRGSYNYWAFHLYPGSNYSLVACMRYSISVVFYVIKGQSSFSQWVTDPLGSQSSGSYYAFVINNPCTSANTTPPRNYSLTFTSEDDYYFAFSGYTSLIFTLSIQQTNYLPDPGDVIQSCTTASFSTCSLDIPYSSGYVLLAETTPPVGGDWSTSVSVSASCVPRPALYVVMEICMAVVVLIGVLAALAYWRPEWATRVLSKIRSLAPQTLPASVAPNTAVPLPTRPTSTAQSEPIDPLPPKYMGSDPPPPYQ